ncbi:hypothetical protein [Pseudofrankia sp. BMG5.36]|uniref:hypothetical protein n=1 Tax=Pseudofrankia sp. BMG5.36 TaxID=1834512 RepID=UPI0008DA24F0|nr:hypothetical protein [Pseudofrankia sp. BMG5.36]OHV44905.1 hypothetical protein BCD48_23880 [Pseudofrankia sp. BMG5.36]
MTTRTVSTWPPAVELTAAELDGARAMLAHYDAPASRRAFALGLMAASIESTLTGAYSQDAETVSLRRALAVAAVVDEIPDRRTVLTARLAEAERYATTSTTVPGWWADQATKLRAELTTLDTLEEDQ